MDGQFQTITTVKELSSGHIRVESKPGCWAQMPRAVWDSVQPGESVPKEYTFEPNYYRLFRDKGGGS